ncbi:MAG: 4Fe-4S dicluster domain-containing protein [Promethearchaeota archaeon]
MLKSNETSTIWSFKFKDDLEKSNLLSKFEKCITCGKCVGDCPASTVSNTYNIRKLIRDMLYGRSDLLLSSEEIWECFLCYTCEVLCPVGLKIPNLIHLLREKALEAGYGYDLIQEIKPMGEYFLNTGTVFKNPTIKMVREKLGITKERIITKQALKDLNQICELTGFKDTIKKIDEKVKSVKARNSNY